MDDTQEMQKHELLRAYDDLRVVLCDGWVAEVEIERPPNNFFDLALVRQLAEVLELLDADSRCRAVVLCSAGKHFCAGANFADRSRATPAADGRHLYDEAVRLFEAQTPIVAAVQGAAIGGGLGLALVADFRVAAPGARFSANFARLGFHHGFGLSVTLPDVVGLSRALELLYTGVRMTGEQALSIGLCDRLVPLDQLRASAHAFAREIAASAPLAVRSIRATMRGTLAARVRDATAHERKEQERLQQTADFREGVRAARERRMPTFHGS